MENKPSVLYVDDEIHSLSAFKSAFRRNYEIFTAISAKEGEKLLEGNDIQIIITDQRMPHITGLEFLTSTIKKHPHAIRILITGYTDIQVSIDVINRCRIYQYVPKPYKPQQLRKILDSASKEYQDNARYREDYEKYKKAYIDLNDPFFIIDISGRIISVNDAMLELLKYSRKEITDLQYQRFFKNKETIKSLSRQLEKKGQFKNVKAKVQDKEKNETDCLISVNSIKDGNNKTIRYIGMIQNVQQDKSKRGSLKFMPEKEHKLAQLTHVMTFYATLNPTGKANEGEFKNHLDYIVHGLNFMRGQLSENVGEFRQFQNIIDSMVDLVILTDSSGIIRFVNKHVEELLGYEQKELVNLEIDSIMSKNINNAYRADQFQILADWNRWKKRRVPFEYIIFLLKHKEKYSVLVNASVSIYKNESGQPKGFIFLIPRSALL